MIALLRSAEHRDAISDNPKYGRGDAPNWQNNQKKRCPKMHFESIFSHWNWNEIQHFVHSLSKKKWLRRRIVAHCDSYRRTAWTFIDEPRCYWNIAAYRPQLFQAPLQWITYQNLLLNTIRSARASSDLYCRNLAGQIVAHRLLGLPTELLLKFPLPHHHGKMHESDLMGIFLVFLFS